MHYYRFIFAEQDTKKKLNFNKTALLFSGFCCIPEKSGKFATDKT
jgi:hypothetical protein